MSHSESTVRRWCDEVIALLAARAPRLDRALAKIARRGGRGQPPTTSSSTDEPCHVSPLTSDFRIETAP